MIQLLLILFDVMAVGLIVMAMLGPRRCWQWVQQRRAAR